MPILESENVKIEKREREASVPLEEDTYQVVFHDIEIKKSETYDSKMGKTNGVKEYENIFNIQFVVLEGHDKTGKSARGRSLILNFVPTFLWIGKNGKNKLYEVIETFLNRDLTAEEEQNFDALKMNKLIGQQGRVVIKNKAAKDDANAISSNIERFLRKKEILPKLTDEELKDVFVLGSKDKQNENSDMVQAAQNKLGGEVVRDQLRPEDIPTIDLEDDIKIEDVPL